MQLIVYLVHAVLIIQVAIGYRKVSMPKHLAFQVPSDKFLKLYSTDPHLICNFERV